MFVNVSGEFECCHFAPYVKAFLWMSGSSPLYSVSIHVNNIANFFFKEKKLETCFWFTSNWYKCSLFIFHFLPVTSVLSSVKITKEVQICALLAKCCWGSTCICMIEHAPVKLQMYPTCENTATCFQFLVVSATSFFLPKLITSLSSQREGCISSDGHRSVPDAFLKVSWPWI